MLTLLVFNSILEFVAGFYHTTVLCHLHTLRGLLNLSAISSADKISLSFHHKLVPSPWTFVALVLGRYFLRLANGKPRYYSTESQHLTALREWRKLVFLWQYELSWVSRYLDLEVLRKSFEIREMYSIQQSCQLQMNPLEYYTLSYRGLSLFSKFLNSDPKIMFKTLYQLW